MLALAVTVLAVGLGGCASRPADPEDLKYYREANDPLEPLNRAVFKFNDVADRAVLRPLAIGYKKIVPRGMRTGVRNFINNLKTPIVLLNDLLQGEGKRAGDTTGRFLANTLLGLGGLIDVAGAAGIPYHGEDFGQTLAVWGVESGPYIVLPILGPSTFRDALGSGIDGAVDPVSIYIGEEYGLEGTATWYVVDSVDWRAKNLDLIDDLRKSSLDFYATVRSARQQQRANEIRNGRGGKDNPDGEPQMIKFDEFDDLDQSGGDDAK